MVKVPADEHRHLQPAADDRDGYQDADVLDSRRAGEQGK